MSDPNRGLCKDHCFFQVNLILRILQDMSLQSIRNKRD